VIGDRLGGQPVELGEFGLELADLVLPPGRRAERMVGDRGQHEETGVGCRFRAEAIYPELDGIARGSV